MKIKDFILPTGIANKQRYWLILANVIGFGLLIGLVTFQSLSDLQLGKAKSEFLTKSKDLSIVLQRALDNEVESLYTLKGLFLASSEVNEDEFRKFSYQIFRFHPSIRNLGWAPVVADRDRRTFEISARSEKNINFTIREGRSDGRLVNADQREFYLPVRYVEPLTGHEFLLGYDMYSRSGRRKHLESAIRSREPVASERVNYAIFDGSPIGFSIFLAVHDDKVDNANATSEPIGGNFLGIVAAIYEVEKLIQSNLGGLMDDVDVGIFDLTDKNITRLYTSNADFQTLAAIRDGDMVHETELEIGGRKWLFVVRSGIAPLANENAALPWFVFSLIVLSSAISAAFLGHLINSRQTIAKQVKEQLAIIGGNEKKLIEMNSELEEFAYRTSHDLRSPIISSKRLLGVSEESIMSNDTKTALSSLSHAKNSLSKLEQLIVDILTLTEAGNKKEDDTRLEIEPIIDNALIKLDNLEGFDRLEIRKKLQFNGELVAKKSRFVMIVENLLSNAIKYQDYEKECSYVSLRTYESDLNFVLEVEDNGLGIPNEFVEQLFSMFKRFHPKIAFGSGLGLYLMKKSATLLDGEINYIKRDDVTLFQLKLPLNRGGDKS